MSLTETMEDFDYFNIGETVFNYSYRARELPDKYSTASTMYYRLQQHREKRGYYAIDAEARAFRGRVFD